MNLFDRVKFFFATTSKVKLIALGTLALVILAIPLTIFIVSQQQDIRQRASAGVIATQPVTPSRYMYINGSSPYNPNQLGPGADWSSDAQVAAMCAKVGRSPCYPDIMSQQPINWDTGAFPVETQLISIGNRFWVRGPFTQLGGGAALQLGRNYYINGNTNTPVFVPENGDVGPGKLWWDMPDIQWMCQQAGKNSAADCKPDIVSQAPSGWDDVPESTQILGFGNKVWVRGPFKETAAGGGVIRPIYGRTYYIKGDNTAAVDVCTTDRAGAACPVSNLGPGKTWWSADSDMQTMCRSAGLNESNCKPSVLTTLPSGWDKFTEATQVIGINNKVWLRSTIKRAGPATFRTYYNIGGGQQANPTEPGGGAHWFDVDTQIQQMCKDVGLNDGNSCQPQMIVQLPVGWDGDVNNQPRYPTQAQLISMHNGIDNKLWVRGPVFVATEQAYDANNGAALTRNPVAGEKIFIRSVSQVPTNQTATNLALLINGASQWIGGNQEWESTANGLPAGNYTLQLVAGCDYGKDIGFNSVTGKSGPDCTNATQYFTATTLTVGAAPTAIPTATPIPATNTPVPPTATPAPSAATYSYTPATPVANQQFFVTIAADQAAFNSYSTGTLQLLVNGTPNAAGFPSSSNQGCRSGTCEFNSPVTLQPGTYTFQLAANSGAIKYTASQPLTISALPTATPTPIPLSCTYSAAYFNSGALDMSPGTPYEYIMNIEVNNTDPNILQYRQFLDNGTRTNDPGVCTNKGLSGNQKQKYECKWNLTAAQTLGTHNLEFYLRYEYPDGTFPDRTKCAVGTLDPAHGSINQTSYKSLACNATFTISEASPITDNNVTVTMTNFTGKPDTDRTLYEFAGSAGVAPDRKTIRPSFTNNWGGGPGNTWTFKAQPGPHTLQLATEAYKSDGTESGTPYFCSGTVSYTGVAPSATPTHTPVPVATATSTPINTPTNTLTPTATSIPVILCERKAGGYPLTCQYVAATNDNDYRHWADRVGKPNLADYLTADYDGNGTVNIVDFNRWRSRKFNFQ